MRALVVSGVLLCAADARADALAILVGDWDVEATEVTAAGVTHKHLQELAVRAAADRVEITVREPGRDAPVWWNAFVLEKDGLVEVWKSGARIRHEARSDGDRLVAHGRLPDGTEVAWSAARVGARLVYQREDRKNGALVASSFEVLTPRAHK